MTSHELWIDFVRCIAHIKILDDLAEMLPALISKILQRTRAFSGKLVLFLNEVHERHHDVLFHKLARGSGELIYVLAHIVSELADIT